MSFGSFVLLPNITGKYGGLWTGNPDGLVQEGALYTDNVIVASMTGGAARISQTILQLKASRSSAIYGNSSTIQPESLILNYVIKY